MTLFLSYALYNKKFDQKGSSQSLERNLLFISLSWRAAFDETSLLKTSPKSCFSFLYWFKAVLLNDNSSRVLNEPLHLVSL